MVSPHALAGSVEEIVEQCLARRERYGISCIGIGLDAMEAMAPVVARLAGPESARPERSARPADAQATRPAATRSLRQMLAKRTHGTGVGRLDHLAAADVDARRGGSARRRRRRSPGWRSLKLIRRVARAWSSAECGKLRPPGVAPGPQHQAGAVEAVVGLSPPHR